jgi:hypothetical protein
MTQINPFHNGNLNKKHFKNVEMTSKTGGKSIKKILLEVHYFGFLANKFHLTIN